MILVNIFFHFSSEECSSVNERGKRELVRTELGTDEGSPCTKSLKKSAPYVLMKTLFTDLKEDLKTVFAMNVSCVAISAGIASSPRAPHPTPQIGDGVTPESCRAWTREASP